MLSVQSNKRRRESRYMLPLNKWTFTFVNLKKPQHHYSTTYIIEQPARLSLTTAQDKLLFVIFLYHVHSSSYSVNTTRSSPATDRLATTNLYNNKILLIKSYEINLCIYLCGIIESSATETTQSTTKRTLTVVSDAHCWFSFKFLKSITIMLHYNRVGVIRNLNEFEMALFK